MKRLFCVVVVFVALAISGVCCADTITANWTWYDSPPVHEHTGGAFFWDITSSTPAGWNNAQFVTVKQGNAGWAAHSGPTQRVISFCIDKDQNIKNTYTLYDDIADVPISTVPAKLGVLGKAMVEELWAEHFWGVGGVKETWENGSAADARLYVDAFQVAIWEIVYDKAWAVDADTDLRVALDLNEGNNQWTGNAAIFDKAQEWLDDVDNSFLVKTPVLFGWDEPSAGDVSQGQIVERIPEAATVINLMGLGLMIGLVGIRRWRR
ncbi:MAG: hypothetical protein HQ567_31290 [Candidatus Nealsonbacteria bacterium]|nr:hypothetical protein [Candidatus Nealsonbacteria bacterium]